MRNLEKISLRSSAFRCFFPLECLPHPKNRRQNHFQLFLHIQTVIGKKCMFRRIRKAGLDHHRVTVSNKFPGTHFYVRGAVASWLVRLTPDRAVRVRALERDIVLCSWARHLTLTVPLSTQVPGTGEFNAGGNLKMD